MTDKAQRIAGLLLAPVIALIGLWLCSQGIGHDKLSGIGPFLALAGSLWFVSDLI
jgi:hypothetical protein